MFGTVIIDAYTKDETEQLAAAIDDLCNPADSYGWASAGIYSFWDYNTHEVLYIGLASDLAERFKQHNGLLDMSEDGCKRRQIEDYFTTHDKLGYTIFVQSPLSQPMVHRNRQQYEAYAAEINTPVREYVSEQGIADIKRVEGILIEAFNQHYGHLPAWNRIGGSIAGQQRVMERNINIVKCFSNPQEFEINPIVSRSTIRELSNNATYAAYESDLHAVRMYVLMMGLDYEDAFNLAAMFDRYGSYKRIYDSGYLNKVLVV